MLYIGNIPQEFILDLKTKRFTLNCLSQSIDIITNTALCQNTDMARCNFI